MELTKVRIKNNDPINRFKAEFPYRTKLFSAKNFPVYGVSFFRGC